MYPYVNKIIQAIIVSMQIYRDSKNKKIKGGEKA